MASTYVGSSSGDFATLYDQLKKLPAPLLPPGKARDPSMTDKIASLYVHPTLEALLHLLNLDLPSAHFLVRHMQAAPALEGMYIHGILHRIEGDYDNCRAWYGDVASSPAFVNFWGREDVSLPESLSFLGGEADALAGEVEEDDKHEGPREGPRLVQKREGGKVPSQKGARAFISAIQALGKQGKGREGYDERRKQLAIVSKAEIEGLVEYCITKFGTQKMPDATTVWAKQDEEHRKMGESMVSGGEGYRKF